ncbi:hypothetical protein ACUSIJ_08420 [Pseudochelatococcus sp. B33]
MKLSGIVNAYMALAKSLAGIDIARKGAPFAGSPARGQPATMQPPAAGTGRVAPSGQAAGQPVPGGQGSTPAGASPSVAGDAAPDIAGRGVTGESHAQVPDAAPRRDAASLPGKTASLSLVGLRLPAPAGAATASLATAYIATVTGSTPAPEQRDAGQRAAATPAVPEGDGASARQTSDLSDSAARVPFQKIAAPGSAPDDVDEGRLGDRATQPDADAARAGSAIRAPTEKAAARMAAPTIGRDDAGDGGRDSRIGGADGDGRQAAARETAPTPGARTVPVQSPSAGSARTPATDRAHAADGPDVRSGEEADGAGLPGHAAPEAGQPAARAPERPGGNPRLELPQHTVLDALDQQRAAPDAAMETLILNAAMIPGWPAPRPFEMPRRVAGRERRPMIPVQQPEKPENTLRRNSRDEVAVQTYLANMGVKRSLIARFRTVLRPVHQRMKILFGLAVLATQVVFTLHTVLAELDSIESEEDDMERQPGEQQRRLRG